MTYTIYGLMTIVALLMGTSAYAGDDHDHGQYDHSEPLVQNGVRMWVPPVEYDHEFSGKLIEYAMAPGMVYDQCKELRITFGVDPGKPRNLVGCSVPISDTLCYVVYIADVVESKEFPGNNIYPEHVRRHEIGHCNGWDH